MERKKKLKKYITLTVNINDQGKRSNVKIAQKKITKLCANFSIPTNGRFSEYREEKNEKCIFFSISIHQLEYEYQFVLNMKMQIHNWQSNDKYLMMVFHHLILEWMMMFVFHHFQSICDDICMLMLSFSVDIK